MTNYDKLNISLRYFLLGKGYFLALDALEYGSSMHVGFRKDGVTPEFQHQLEISHYIRTLPALMYPEATITAVLLHDVSEDYNVTNDYLAQRFGSQVARSVFLMDKTKNADFNDIGLDPIASIAKGGDRIHNIKTMHGVFTPDKQRRYVQQARDEFIPMIKVARRMFPQQEAAYENIKHVMSIQIDMVNALHSADNLPQ